MDSVEPTQRYLLLGGGSEQPGGDPRRESGQEIGSCKSKEMMRKQKQFLI